KLQEGLGGRAKFLTYLITAIVVVVLVALIFVPWELKMDAKGQLMPEERWAVYAPRAGKVERILVERGKPFGHRQVMIEMDGNDIQAELLNRPVRPNDQLLRLGEISGAWEIEIKIPQKHIGKVLEAFEKNEGKDLDVELKLSSQATESYRGKLARSKVAPAAV